ncbi:MAG: hypothetical protein PHV06_06360 [bacterium]|nr:hypothetical protein [bacterium]
MKKGVFLVVIVMLLSTLVNAESFMNSIEVKFGATTANQRLIYPNGDKRTFDNMSGSGIMLSANLFENELGNGFKFQFFTDLGTIEKGMKDKYHYFDTTGTWVTDYHENTVTYLSLVPSARLSLYYKRVYLYGYAGPRVDMFMSYDQESEYEKLFLTSDGTRYVTWETLFKKYNNMVMGVTVGGGWGIIVGKDKNFLIFSELRADQDMTTAPEDVLELENTTAWLFSFGIGYVLK